MDCDHLLQDEIEYFKKKDEQKNMNFEIAQQQILRNDLAKAAQLRDEYKMQLDAANKEIELLKEDRAHAIRLAFGSDDVSAEEIFKENKEYRELIKKEREEAFQEVKRLKELIASYDKGCVEIYNMCEAHIGSDKTLEYTLVGAVENLIKYFNEVKQQRDEYEVKYLEYQRDLNTQEEVNNQLRKQIANAEETIVGLRKLREEEKDGVEINDPYNSKEYNDVKHQCTVNWLNETEGRLAEAHLEIRDLKKENKKLKESFGPKNEYKDAIVNELYNTHLYTKELENDPWRAMHKIVCWHYNLGSYFQKQKSLSKKIKNLYVWLFNKVNRTVRFKNSTSREVVDYYPQF